MWLWYKSNVKVKVEIFSNKFIESVVGLSYLVMKLYHHNTIIAFHMHFIYYWSCCSDYLITYQYFLDFILTEN